MTPVAFAQSAPRKMLIVLLGAIGDVVRALPLAMRIKRHWPDVELHWAVEPISRTLVEGHPAVDRVIVFDRPRGLPAFLEFIRELRAMRYELVLDLQRHLKSGVASFSTGAPVRLGFNRVNSREGNWLFNTLHVRALEHFSSKVQQFQAFGDALGLAPLEPLDFGLRAEAEELAKIEHFVQEHCARAGFSAPGPERRVAFILGSTWPSRFWTAAHYVSLARILFERWAAVCLLVGSAREREFSQSIAADLTELPFVNLVEQTSLHELVAVFSSVSVAVGSDSGPMHIAAAVGVPVVSLWGSTSPRRSAPYGSQDYVLASAIGCAPCYKRICPGLGTLCMEQLCPDLVANKVAQIWNGGRSVVLP